MTHRVTTFTNSPDSLTPTELNSIEDDYEAGVRQKVQLFEFTTSGLLTGPADRIIGPPSLNAVVTSSTFAIGSMAWLFHFDPEMWRTLVATRLPRIELEGFYQRGSTTAGVQVSLTIVRLVTPITGASGSSPVAAISTASPAIGFSAVDASGTRKTTGDVDASAWAAGLYAVRAIFTGTHSGLGWSVNGRVLARAS